MVVCFQNTLLCLLHIKKGTIFIVNRASFGLYYLLGRKWGRQSRICPKLSNALPYFNLLEKYNCWILYQICYCKRGTSGSTLSFIIKWGKSSYKCPKHSVFESCACPNMNFTWIQSISTILCNRGQLNYDGYCIVKPYKIMMRVFILKWPQPNESYTKPHAYTYF